MPQKFKSDIKEVQRYIDSDFEKEGRKTTKIWRRVHEGVEKEEMIEILDTFFIGIKTIEIYCFRILSCCYQFWEKGKKISGNLSQNFEYAG